MGIISGLGTIIAGGMSGGSGGKSLDSQTNTSVSGSGGNSTIGGIGGIANSVVSAASAMPSRPEHGSSLTRDAKAFFDKTPVGQTSIGTGTSWFDNAVNNNQSSTESKGLGLSSPSGVSNMNNTSLMMNEAYQDFKSNAQYLN